jgi:hypothetical protein
MTLAVGSLLVAACADGSRDEVLGAFETNLAAHDSATEALRLWCSARGIAINPEITAQFVRDHDQPAPAGLRQIMDVSHDEPLGYRHVRLSCQGKVLSEANNWYVPGRLSSEMNRALAETDTPFGKVAAPLHFSRSALEMGPEVAKLCPSGSISMHRALLRLPDGKPLALVIECYTAANLAR